MAIKIKGVIGLDVIGTQFADMMSRLSGDVNIELDSPGGFLSDGISIFNAIEDYNKGKVNITVVGQASSMGAYVMLSGDTLKFKSNSTVMLHNPLNCCCGDYIAMEKNADLLKRFSALYANKFVEKGIFKEKEIRSIMDATTYFIGAEELSIIGEVIQSDKSEPQDRETAMALAQEHIKTCEAKMRAAANEDFERIAALLPTNIQANIQANAQPNLQANNTNNNSNNIVQNEKEKEIMDLNELKEKYPEIHAQALKDGAQKETARIAGLMKWIDVDKDTVIKAINDGKSIHDDEVQSTLLMAKANGITIKAMADENPPAVAPGEPNHAPEGELTGDEKTVDKEKEAKEAEAKETKDLQAVMAHLGYDAE